jgi:hypothetical protein
LTGRHTDGDHASNNELDEKALHLDRKNDEPIRVASFQC